jgi:hypothetical protein
LRERLADESGRDPKSFTRKRIENRSERGQDVGLSRLHEHSECSAYPEATLLRCLSAGAFVDEQQIRVKRLCNEDGGCFSPIQSEILQGRRILNDANPRGLSDRIDTGR